MGANGGVDVVVLFRQVAGRPGGGKRASRIHQQGNALLRQRPEQFLPIGVKGFIVHMGVGVK